VETVPPGHQRACALTYAQSLGSATEKKTLTAVERNRPETERARRSFQAKLSRVLSRDLVFVDESGVRTDLTRRYGRAPKGERVREAVPQGHWKMLTLVGALSAKGIQASLTDTARLAV
jgi:DDE superfamily endonuclease